MRRARGQIALAALALGCSGKPAAPPPPAPPVVQVLPAASNVLDTQLAVDVRVDGCDAVKTLTLADRQRALKTVSDAQVRTSFAIAPGAIDLKSDGIAAALDLIATATCANGASATSDGVGVRFMPADAVFPGALGPGASFSMDPDGTALVQCVAGRVERLDTTGAALNAVDKSTLGFDCTEQGYLARGSADELYWVEPGSAFARLRRDLTWVQSYSFPVDRLYLPAQGRGFATAVGVSGGGSQMLWVDRTTGQAGSPIQLDGIPDGLPALSSGGVLVVPLQSTDLSSGLIQLETQRFNLSTGDKLGPPTVLATTPAGPLGSAVVPALTLSADGLRAYFVAGADGADLYGCGSDRACTQAAGGLVFQWHLDNGPYTIALPVGDALVAAGPGAAQFVDLQTGAPLGDPLRPSGGLSVLYVLAGAGTDSYLLAGDPQGNVLELALLDAPAHLAARYHRDSGAFGFDLDGQGRPYVLLGGRLTRLLLPADYAGAQR